MYRHILMMILLCVIYACNKQPVGPTYPSSRTIIGKWEWYKTTGFFINDSPQNTGKTYHMIFNADSTCEGTGTLDPRLMGTGSFSLALIGSGLFQKNLTFTVGTNRKSCSYRIKNYDTLILDYGSFLDQPVYYFSREW